MRSWRGGSGSADGPRRALFQGGQAQGCYYVPEEDKSKVTGSLGDVGTQLPTTLIMTKCNKHDALLLISA